MSSLTVNYRVGNLRVISSTNDLIQSAINLDHELLIDKIPFEEHKNFIEKLGEHYTYLFTIGFRDRSNLITEIIKLKITKSYEFHNLEDKDFRAAILEITTPVNIKFIGCQLQSATLEHLHSRGLLNSLSLVNCDFTKVWKNMALVDPFEPKPLKYLTLVDDKAIDVDGLSCLINNSQVSMFSITTKYDTSSLLKQIFSRMTNIKIKGHTCNTEEFNVLRRCPKLESLTIEIVPQDLGTLLDTFAAHKTLKFIDFKTQGIHSLNCTNFKIVHTHSATEFDKQCLRVQIGSDLAFYLVPTQPITIAAPNQQVIKLSDQIKQPAYTPFDIKNGFPQGGKLEFTRGGKVDFPSM